MASPQSVVSAPARLVSVLQHFPPVAYAFAYGSGAHHQPGLYESSEAQNQSSNEPQVDGLRRDAGAEASTTADHKISFGRGNAASSAAGLASSVGRSSRGPVIDYIFAVKDAHEWHSQNLERNPEHYSWVGRLGANVVCGVAEAVGVGLHFNPLVQLDTQTTIKYGVIEAAFLERDLALWEHLYLAGRMQKPVTPLTTAPMRLAAAQAANLRNALAAALVLLPPTFTEEELLRTLVGLSYRGDVRLAVRAEDPHKVARILEGSWDELYGMYAPLLAECQRHSALGLEEAGEVSGAARGGRLWRQAKDPAAQGAALRLLAPGLLHEMAARLGYHIPVEHLTPGTSTQAEVVEAAVRTGVPQRLAADSLAAIVRRSSIYQAAAGLLAAGGGKAVQYVAAKMAKAVRPMLAAASTTAARSGLSKVGRQ